MRLLAHRGCWADVSEKNQDSAFKRAFASGFGVETDIRDSGSALVISHDVPGGGEMSFQSFLETAENTNGTLALNIKSDGLADMVKATMRGYHHLDWFVFDMSVPDMLAHIKVRNRVFTRLSDFEREPVCLEMAEGVWLDAFEKDWFGVGTVESLLANGKRVCVVSPELHGRDHLPLWHALNMFKANSNVMLCTDYPEDANVFFGVTQ